METKDQAFLSTVYAAFCLHDSFISSRRAGTEPRLRSLRVVPEPQGYSCQLTRFPLLSAPCQNTSKGEAALGHLSLVDRREGRITL